MKGFTQVTLAALATLAAARVVDRKATGLSIELKSTGNTKVVATLTNTGAEDVNLLSVGTLLDPMASVQKVQVSSADADVPFTGIRKRIAQGALNADAFTALAAGSSMDIEFDVAATHDLSAGGAFSLLAQGAIPIAPAGSNVLSDSIPFTSNTLDVDVDGAEAAKVESAGQALAKRATVNADCTGTRRTSTVNAIADCVGLANNAATAATSGSATKFSEYFKSTATATRSTVASCFRSVASQCGTTTSGAVAQHCADVLGGCSSNVLAYTLPSQRLVVNCPLYFSALPLLTNTCHAQDQTTTTIHEYTHALCGTQDNGYGYAAATRLSSAQAVANADSYALFSNAIRVGC